jgi:hypothetical protein
MTETAATGTAMSDSHRKSMPTLPIKTMPIAAN